MSRPHMKRQLDKIKIWEKKLEKSKEALDRENKKDDPDLAIIAVMQFDLVEIRERLVVLYDKHFSD